MIKVEHTEVFGWAAAIRGMRNPMNSWDKSDSYWHSDNYGNGDEYEFVVGENDLVLMKNLSRAGDDHGKVMRYLEVYVDITAPLYWWKEFKTYRKDRRFMDDGDDFLNPDELEMHIETNSCSTMHKIHSKKFTIDDFSHEHLTRFEDMTLVGDVVLYDAKQWLSTTIAQLNFTREKYLKTKDKEFWYQMIQMLPSSYNQKRTVKMNYQVLKNMYHARKNHKLDEWREFCKWIERLPYSEIITGEKEN